MPKDKNRGQKPSQKAPEDYPGMNDAKRVTAPDQTNENVGQRRPDAESGDDLINGHPDDRENESDRDNANADGEGYEQERSGAV